MFHIRKNIAGLLLAALLLSATSPVAVSAAGEVQAGILPGGESGALPGGGDGALPSAQPIVSGPAVTSPIIETGRVETPAVETASTDTVITELATTKHGKIRGKKSGRAHIWLGVPYGQTKRWKAPEAPTSWNGIKSCKKKKTVRGNNCLFVNIYTPAKTTGDRLPVMVFLHGGGNVGGTANQNFNSFAKETKAVVVSVEFRQGAFGWFQSRGLKTGNQWTDSGNFAMLDIRLALQWVQQNISEFGGDRANVTLTGFSAGARDTLNCVISPMMKGLFHKVISFSGGMTTCSVKEGKKWSNEKLAGILVRRGRFSGKNRKKRALGYVKRISKKKLAKLLNSLTDQEIRWMTKGKSQLRLTNFPQCFRDGKVIPKVGFECLEWGGYNRVPMLVSSNKSEFANASNKVMRRILQKNPKTFKNRKQFYNLMQKAKKYGSELQSSFYLEKVANKVASDPYHENIYAYRFAWGESKSVVGSEYARYVGAIHGMDLDFLLGKYKKGNAQTSDNIYKASNLEGRKALTSVMRQYVRNFLYKGDPNGTDASGNSLTVWNKWSRTKGSRRIMTFSASRKKAKVAMTSRYINRARCKKKMRKNLSKNTYRFLKTRVLNDRFFA